MTLACPRCGRPATEPKFRPFCDKTCSNADLDRVRGGLLGNLELLAETLLGAPSIRKPRTWRWGAKGSLAVELHGRERGKWYDHEAGKGGNPFSLVARTRACSIGDAIVWSRAWSGGEANYTESPRGRMPSKDDAADIAAHARQIEDAQGLWRGSTPAHATLAATYLGVR